MTTTDFSQLEEIGLGKQMQDQVSSSLINFALFKDFSSKELEQIMQYIHVYKAPKGSILFQEGERDTYMLIITEGKAEILKNDDTGTNKKIATVMRGSVLGEISVIDNFPHSATVITCEASEIVLLTKTNFVKITEDFPQLGVKLLWKIATQLSSRLRQASGVLVDYIE